MVIVVVVVIVYLSVCLSVCLFVCLSVCLSASLKTQLFCDTSSIFQLDIIQNEAILRDFLNFWTWQYQKRSNSVRRPSKMESWVQSWLPRTNRFCDFPLHLSKILRLPRKIDARPYEAVHLPRKIILANLQIWCSKMQPFRKSAPSPPNISDEHVSCTAPATENASWHTLFKCPTLAEKLQNIQNPHIRLTFEKARNPLRLPHKTTSERPKVFRNPQFFALLTSKCASRHNGVHFFESATSKSAPELRCFVRFDLEMCVVPQRRAIFHLSSGQLAPHPPLSRAYFSTLRSHKPLENTMFRDFPTFSRTWIFFLLRLSLFWSSFFFSSLLWLFPSLLICPYCRKFDFYFLWSLTAFNPSNQWFSKLVQALVGLVALALVTVLIGSSFLSLLSSWSFHICINACRSCTKL